MVGGQFLSPIPLLADYVRLTDGTAVRGTILQAPPAQAPTAPTPPDAPKTPITIRLLDESTTTIPPDRTAYYLRRPLKFEEYEQSLEQVADSAPAHWELAEWCRKNGMEQDRRYHLQRVLDFDPHHPEAHKALGEFLFEGEWITQDDKMALQGLVRYKGKYVRPDEALREERTGSLKASEKIWFKKIAAIRPRLSGPEKPAAVRELEEITDPAAIRALIVSFQDVPEPELRQLLVRLLSRIHDPAAARALVAQGLYDIDEKISEAAFAAIPVGSRPRAVELLIRGLRHKGNMVVNRAAKGLALLDARSAVTQLISALNTDHLVPVQSVITTPSNLGTIASGNLPILDEAGSYPAFFYPAMIDGIVMPFGAFDQRITLIQDTLQFQNNMPVLGQSALVYGFGGPSWRPMVNRQTVVSWERRPVQNPYVLAALIQLSLTNTDYGYDERAWSRWWASQQPLKANP